jgi:hypothetical protein
MELVLNLLHEDLKTTKSKMRHDFVVLRLFRSTVGAEEPAS